MQCEFIGSGGDRCNAPSLRGKRLCFAHEPSVAAQRHEARTRGGKSRSKPRQVLPLTAGDMQLQSAGDVLALLGQTISQVRRGEVDGRIANAVGYLCSVGLRALEGAGLEARLAALEARLQQRAS
jgi:hypothetical protein